MIAEKSDHKQVTFALSRASWERAVYNSAPKKNETAKVVIIAFWVKSVVYFFIT